MSEPEITAKELASQLETENGERVKKVLQFGFPPPVLDIIAIKARIEAVIEGFPEQMQDEIGVRYELLMAQILDQAISDLTKAKLAQPQQGLLLPS